MTRIDAPPEAWSSLASSLQVVECELNTDCNRACRYCPQAMDLVPRGGVMSDAVLDLLLADLSRFDFSGRFSHHLYGEPLLHPDLDRQVRRIGAALPRAVQVMFTNGDLLTDERHAQLLDAGIALFAVTRHVKGPYPERRRQAVQPAKELHFTSRGGTIAWLKRRRSREELLATRCFAPTEMAVVAWNGLILRCYEDATRQEPFGDLTTHTLAAVWAQTAEKRAALERGRRDLVGGACLACDNTSHDRPDQSVATEPFWTRHPDAIDVAAHALSVRRRE